MSSNSVDEWSLVRDQFEVLMRERSDNIDDLLDAQFCNRFSQLITHATDRARLRAHSENGGRQRERKQKISWMIVTRPFAGPFMHLSLSPVSARPLSLSEW
jgi:hypothetical protein